MMEILITTWNRLAYLKLTIKGIKENANAPVRIYACDGGSTDGTIEWLKGNQDIEKMALFEDNPGADHLKSYGAKEFVEGGKFFITSDDIVPPKDYIIGMLGIDYLLNSGKLEYVFICPTTAHLNSIFEYQERKWQNVRGVDLIKVGAPQPQCSLVDKKTLEGVGYFPRQYGKSGSGDFALGKRIAKLGHKSCYVKDVVVEHIGASKEKDYPEYSKDFDADKNSTSEIALLDNLPDVPIAEPKEVIMK